MIFRFVLLFAGIWMTNGEKCTCGRRIRGGIGNRAEVAVNEFPMMAAVVKAWNGEFQCGGVVISERWAITPLHCVALLNKGKPQLKLTFDEMKLVIGEHRWYKDHRGDPEIAKNIVGANLFTEFNKTGKNEHDIAILKVDPASPFKFGNNFEPACLPWDERNETFDGETVLVMGWGETSDDHVSGMIKVAEATINDPQYCKAQFGKDFCASVIDKYICTGDAGGPVLWEVPGSGELKLVGIMSGAEISKSGDCADEIVIDVRITSYLDWIKGYDVANTLCIPDLKLLA